MLKEYFFKNHINDIEEILDAADDGVYYSIYINFVSLFEADADIAQKILHSPRQYLPLCDEDAIKVQEQVAQPHQLIKRRIRTRITAVPVRIDDGEIGELVATNGITVRTSQPTVLKVMKRFYCKKCKHVTIVKLEWERLTFPETKKCEACGAVGLTTSSSFEQEDCSDYQEIKIQERHKSGKYNSYTEALQVILLEDLVDKCRPGDSIDISGIIVRRWGPLIVGRRMEATTIMIANSVSVQRKISNSMFSTDEIKDIFKNYWAKYENNPLLGRDNIVAAICPQLYGMYTVKLALALILAGGVSKTSETGTRIRGDPHLLMIGDPGTGKSQILRAAARLAVRSVLTTGIGSTAAGLTATAVKDSNGWHLEGGALVLADGGVCCVDELTTMSAQDRACVHEAMEQQTISVAKAGLVSTLNSRCSVIAAINPEGGCFTNSEEWKTRLGDPLLSRFDLILLLKDNVNSEWDRMTSDHILNAAYKPSDNAVQIDFKKHIDLLKTEGLWKEDTLREYFAHIRNLKPVLTQEAMDVISATYLYHRSNPNSRAERKTVRLLDSLIRLAEGHAKLMYRTNVQVIDAITAADIIVSTGTKLGCPFPSDPMSEYRAKGKDILEQLGLQELESFLYT